MTSIMSKTREAMLQKIDDGIILDNERQKLILVGRDNFVMKSARGPLRGQVDEREN